MGLAILLGLTINFNYSQNYAEDELRIRKIKWLKLGNLIWLVTTGASHF